MYAQMNAVQEPRFVPSHTKNEGRAVKGQGISFEELLGRAQGRMDQTKASGEDKSQATDPGQATLQETELPKENQEGKTLEAQMTCMAYAQLIPIQELPVVVFDAASGVSKPNTEGVLAISDLTADLDPVALLGEQSQQEAQELQMGTGKAESAEKAESAGKPLLSNLMQAESVGKPLPSNLTQAEGNKGTETVVSTPVQGKADQKNVAEGGQDSTQSATGQPRETTPQPKLVNRQELSFVEQMKVQKSPQEQMSETGAGKPESAKGEVTKATAVGVATLKAGTMADLTSGSPVKENAAKLPDPLSTPSTEPMELSQKAKADQGETGTKNAKEQTGTDLKLTGKEELLVREDGTFVVKTPEEGGKIHVKVADVPLKADAPDFPQKLAEKILFKAGEGRTEFDLQLSPKELGDIHIKLIFEAGKAQVTVQCAGAEAKQLLMGSAEAIKTIIEQGTGAGTQVLVKEEAKDPQQRDFDDRNDQGQKRQEEPKKDDRDKVDAAVFLQQLRLGLIEKEV